MRAAYEESLKLFCNLGNTPGVAFALSNLASINREQVDRDLAQRRFDEALTIVQEQGYEEGVASSPCPILRSSGHHKGFRSSAAHEYPLA